MRSFWLGSTSANRLTRGARLISASSRICPISAPVMTRSTSMPTLSATCRAIRRLSPLMIFTATPSSRSAPRAHRARVGRRTAGSRRRPAPAHHRRCSALPWSASQAEHPIAGGAPGSEAGRQCLTSLGGQRQHGIALLHERRHLQHVIQRTLADQPWRGLASVARGRSRREFHRACRRQSWPAPCRGRSRRSPRPAGCAGRSAATR